VIPTIDCASGQCGSIADGLRKGGSVERPTMFIVTFLIIVLLLVVLGIVPTWPHGADWGYLPSGALGVLLVVLVALMVTRRA
jgi:hypothetical protein